MLTTVSIRKFLWMIRDQETMISGFVHWSLPFNHFSLKSALVFSHVSIMFSSYFLVSCSSVLFQRLSLPKSTSSTSSRPKESVPPQKTRQEAVDDLTLALQNSPSDPWDDENEQAKHVERMDGQNLSITLTWDVWNPQLVQDFDHWVLKTKKKTKLSCQSTQSSSQSLSWVKIHPVQAKICGLAKAPYKPTNTESAMYFWDCESQILHRSHIHPPIPSRTSRLEIVWMVRAWIFKDINSTLEFPPFAFLSVLNDSCQVLWTHPKWVVSSFIE